MKKLKIGDIVKIKSLNWYRSKATNGKVNIKTKSENYINFNKEMTKFCGKKYKITHISFCEYCKEDHFYLEGEAETFCYWIIEMFDLDEQLEFNFEK